MKLVVRGVILNEAIFSNGKSFVNLTYYENSNSTVYVEFILSESNFKLNSGNLINMH